ncbi:DNA-binding protein [Vreelandella andesensis]|uniref:DNA-binding protein n=2 Tax=Vreelandella andesensis TaxID=447567 RepID=A0A3S0Y8C4_9GAMM|nr:DNA-binding protein [Halomonas andesensis]
MPRHSWRSPCFVLPTVRLLVKTRIVIAPLTTVSNPPNANDGHILAIGSPSVVAWRCLRAPARARFSTPIGGKVLNNTAYHPAPMRGGNRRHFRIYCMLYYATYNKYARGEMTMALTHEQVHSTADQIAAQGEKPTLASIRKALGGGSFTTISEAMQSWRQQQQKEHALAEIRVPEAVTERLQQLQAAAWRTAMEEAERRLSAERAALNESQASAQAAVHEAQEAVNTLETEAEQKDTDVRRLQTQVETAEAVAKDALSGKREAQQQLDSTKAQLEERIAGLEQRLTDAIEARKAAEQREVAANEKLTARDDKLEALRDRLAEAETKIATAEARTDERAEALRTEVARHQEEVAQLNATVKAQETQYQEQLSSMQTDLNSVRQTIQKIEQAYTDEKERAETLERELAAVASPPSSER